MTDLAKLIADIESAEEGSRELGDQVLLACGWQREAGEHPGLSADYGEYVEVWYWRDPDGQHMGTDRPDPARNLQDAVDAVPEGWLPNCGIARYDEEQHKKTGLYGWGELDLDPYNGTSIIAWSTTPALALCAAILRAKELERKDSL